MRTRSGPNDRLEAYPTHSTRCRSLRTGHCFLERRAGSQGGFCGDRTKSQPWSGRRDSNPRPLEPHSSALPSCATARRQRSAKMRCDRGFFKQEKHCTPKRLPSGPDLGAPEVRPSAEPGCKHGPWSPYFTGVGRPRNAPFTSPSSFEATDPAPRLTL
jgi:hypothetical protein